MLSVFSMVSGAQESLFRWQKISEKVSEESREMLGLWDPNQARKAPEEGQSLEHFLSSLSHEHLLSSYCVPTPC